MKWSRARAKKKHAFALLVSWLVLAPPSASAIVFFQGTLTGAELLSDPDVTFDGGFTEVNGDSLRITASGALNGRERLFTWDLVEALERLDLLVTVSIDYEPDPPSPPVDNDPIFGLADGASFAGWQRSENLDGRWLEVSGSFGPTAPASVETSVDGLGTVDPFTLIYMLVDESGGAQLTAVEGADMLADFPLGQALDTDAPLSFAWFGQDGGEIYTIHSITITIEGELAPPIPIFSGSPDVQTEQLGTTLRPFDVSNDLEVIQPMVADLGPLPDGADVVAYSEGAGGERYFALDHSATLAGGLLARPRDVVAWDGASYSIAVDGASAGFPDGVGLDAIEVVPGGTDFWLSFDTSVDVAGTPLRDADVFLESDLSLVFDASAAGIPAGLDVDGVSRASGALAVLVSFDTGGTLGGVEFRDEDVLRYEATSDTWALELDASATGISWDGADLDAIHLVPEPGFGVALGLGVCGMAGSKGRRRRGRTRWVDPDSIGETK